MKTGEGYLLDGCRAWTCELVVTGIAEAQKEVNRMDDTISRQAAIDAIYETFCYAYCDNCEKEMNEDLCGDCHRKYQNWAASKKIISKTMNSLPSAQPERKKGKWIRHDEIKNVYGGICIECSECGEKYVVQYMKDEKFCRNCGTDMRSDK